MSNLAGLKRVDEHRLNDLRGRAQSKDPSLTEMDLLWLSVLEDRYALFLEEGMKALKALQPKDPKPSVATAPSNGSFPDSGSSSPVTHASSGSSFVGSLISLVNRKRSSTTVSSSSLPVQQETSRLCKHWSWVADNLVIGAIPFADMTVTDPSAHLIGLREQCRDRGTMVSLVVSALEFDEAASEDLREFASPREWELALGTTAFVHVGLPQDSNAKIALSYDDLAAACVQIHDAMVHRSKCVFVHCKAGLQRSWVIAVCYLVAHRNMTFDEANGLLSVVRPQFAPSPVQVEYAQGFEAYIRQLRAPLRSREDDDATYARLLAELLSLPPEYRKRLLRDMEHLT